MTFLYIYLIGGILSVGLLAYQAAKKENGYDEQVNLTQPSLRLGLGLLCHG